MNPVGDRFELVQITGGFRLLDSRLQECVYWRHDGARLAPGYYAVHCPVGVPAGAFNDAAIFRDPFKHRDDAERALADLESRASRRTAHAMRRPPQSVERTATTGSDFRSRGSTPSGARDEAAGRLISFIRGNR